MTLGNPTKSWHSKSTLTRVGIVLLILFAVPFAFTQKHAAAAQTIAPAAQVIQNLVLVGTSTIQATPLGSGVAQAPEIAADSFGDSSVKGAGVAQAPASPTSIRRWQYAVAVPRHRRGHSAPERNQRRGGRPPLQHLRRRG